MTRLMTIGYEGASLDGLLACLSEAGVTSLIDVRERPYSRRKDFNKRRLSEALATVDIDYLHLPGLGTPKPGRDAARAGDGERFRDIFRIHMNTKEYIFDLTRCIEIVASGGACLLCLERDPQRCHRSLVARDLCQHLDLEIEDLTAR